MQRSQRGGSIIVRVRQQTERRALEQARRVPWKRLAEAAEEYTDWQVFTLWLRAVVEAAGNIPAMVAEEMESRTPQLLGRIHPAGRRGGCSEWEWRRFQDLARCQRLGGDQHLYRCGAGRLVGGRPLFLFDVATLDESVVTLGRHRQAVARSSAATLSKLRTVAVWSFGRGPAVESRQHSAAGA